MIWNNGTLFVFIVVRICHMIETKIIKDGYADGVEQEDAAGFGNERDLYRVKPKAQCFTCTKNAAKDANVVSELSWVVGHGSEPVVYDVVPELLRHY